MNDVRTADARFAAEDLHDFIARSMRAVRTSDDDAQAVADVLTSADLRGIESHGIAQLERSCIDLVQSSRIDPAAAATTLHQSSTSLAIDARNGLGHPVSVRTMAETIGMAAEAGIAAATVRNSNDHGSTSYYAMMALSRNMIGVAATNTPGQIAPAFGHELSPVSNQIAVTVPAADGDSFVFDLTASARTQQKLEVASRAGSALTGIWAPAFYGAVELLGRHRNDVSGLPGYGASVLIELLTGVLAGGLSGPSVPASTNFFDATGATSHFFMAIDIARFRNIAAFRSDVATALAQLRETEPGAGMHQHAPGDFERRTARQRLAYGVALDRSVISSMWRVASTLNIALPFPLQVSQRATAIDLEKLII